MRYINEVKIAGACCVVTHISASGLESLLLGNQPNEVAFADVQARVQVRDGILAHQHGLAVMDADAMQPQRAVM